MADTAHPPLVLGERRDLSTITLVGVLLAVALVLLVGAAADRLWVTDPRVVLVLSYLAVWVPILGAVLWAGRGSVSGSVLGSGVPARGLGLWFRPIDLLWGLAVGLLARVVASLIEIAGYGQMGSAGPTLGTVTTDAWWLFAALLAPVVFAPLIEELFFRGLLLRSVARTAAAAGASPRAALATAAMVSAAVFALVHIVQVGPGTGAIVVGVSTFIFGLGAAAVAAATGRIGGAVVAHVTFNALVVVPVILGQL